MSTKIEWVRNADGTAGETWNPVRGCSRVSRGCERCYAERMAARALPGLRSPITDSPYALMTPVGPRWTGKVELIESQLDIPLRRKKPTTYFVNSMSDLFHESLSDEAIDRVFAVMALCPQHRFQVLTKRAERALGYFGPSAELDGMTRDCLVEGEAQKLYHDRTGEDPSLWLAVQWPLRNCWLGFSAEDQERFDERWLRMKSLARDGWLVWCSYEPALGPLEVRDALATGLRWVVSGFESGLGARPGHPAWVRKVRDDCVAAGVPFFFKQMCELGRKIPFEEIPLDLQVREFPRSERADCGGRSNA